MNGDALGSSLKYVSYLVNVPKIIRGSCYSRQQRQVLGL